MILSFKSIDKKYLNQCISYYEKGRIDEENLRFECDGFHARFDQPLFKSNVDRP